MPKPLPIELRSRVVEAYNNGEGTFHELGIRFQVCLNTVYRWVRLQRRNQDLSPKPYGTGSRPRLNENELDTLRLLVTEKSDRTVSELSLLWNDRYDIKVSRTTMGRALLRAGLPFKKRLSARWKGIVRM